MPAQTPGAVTGTPPFPVGAAGVDRPTTGNPVPARFGERRSAVADDAGQAPSADQRSADDGPGTRAAAERPTAAAQTASSDDRRDRASGLAGERAATDGMRSRPEDGARPAAALLPADVSPLSETLIALAGRDWSGGDGGIIPSFILNAAMIPGWPPPRPFDAPPAEALTRAAAAALPDEEAILRRFAERGGPSLGAQFGLLLKRASRRRRRRMLAALAAVMETIDAVLSAIEQELLNIARSAEADDDMVEAGLRRQLTA